MENMKHNVVSHYISLSIWLPIVYDASALITVDKDSLFV